MVEWTLTSDMVAESVRAAHCHCSLNMLVVMNYLPLMLLRNLEEHSEPLTLSDNSGIQSGSILPQDYCRSCVPFDPL